MPSYAEFRLRIERGVTSRSYRIVASGVGGEATGRLLLPFSDIELENFVLRLGRPRRGTRRVDSPEMALARTFGTKLFDAVFDGNVRELYRSAVTEANDLGQGLRVSLAMTDAPELAQIPWEYLFDRPNFLSISTWSPIVRYLDLPKPPRPLQLTFPLRILGMVSAPSDAEPINVAEEKAKLEQALSALVSSGAVAIDWLNTANLLTLARQLRRADYHVFHFIGHGGFDAEAKDGVLLFEDDGGRSERVSGAQLGDILHDEKTLRLAVLNACEGARTSVEDPFAGVATSLIEREIPAVIGMQFEITDKAAIVFASEFYSTLADGQPVDAAISEARKSIYAMGNDIEWGTPVLFMRVQDGRLFDVQPHAPVVRVDPQVIAAAATAPAAVDDAVRGGDAGTVQGPEAAERDRVAAEAAAAAERDRLAAAAEAAERDRLAAEAAERDRVAAMAAEAAERERVAAAAERDRLAAEAAERDRLAAAAEAAQRERVAAAAERDRLAAEAAERDRVAAAAEAAERDRLAAEAAERDRVAAAAERDRLAAEAAERDRRAAAAAAEAAERDRVAAMAAEAAERDRLAAEETAALRKRLEMLEEEQAEQTRRQYEAEQRGQREQAAAIGVPMAGGPAPAVTAPAVAYPATAAPKAKGGHGVRNVLAIVVVVLVGLGAWSTFQEAVVTPLPLVGATMPDVTGQLADDAVTTLSDAGFENINHTSTEVPCDSGFTSGQVWDVVDGNAVSLTGQVVVPSEPIWIVVADTSNC